MIATTPRDVRKRRHPHRIVIPLARTDIPDICDIFSYNLEALELIHEKEPQTIQRYSRDWHNPADQESIQWHNFEQCVLSQSVGEACYHSAQHACSQSSFSRIGYRWQYLLYPSKHMNGRMNIWCHIRKSAMICIRTSRRSSMLASQRSEAL